MKSKRTLLFFVILFSTQTTFAQNHWLVKSGMNFSTFRTVDSEKRTGFEIGIGREWKIYKNTYIGCELMYGTKGCILKDIIIGGGYVKYVFNRDLYCSARFIELPVLLKYNIPINKAFSCYFLLGPSLSIAVRDNSKILKQTFLFEVRDQNEWDNLDYDYNFNIDKAGPLPYITDSSGYELNTGIGIIWSSLFLEVIYSYDFYDIETIISYDIYERFHSLHILVGYRF
jgi:hypothetical protein